MQQEEDRQLLRHALRKTDAETQSFLQPLVGITAVQELLVSFVKDDSGRSFSDWVWDRQVQQVLSNLRSMNPSSNGDNQLLTDQFSRMQINQIQNDVAPKEPESPLARAADARVDGKYKFQKGDYYSAMNAFKRALKLTRQRPDDRQEVTDQIIVLSCNIAVCGLKLQDAGAARHYAGEALALDPQCAKAQYALAKGLALQKQWAEARDVIVQAVADHPGNRLLAAFEQELTDMEEAHRQKEQRELVEQERKAEEDKIKQEQLQLERARVEARAAAEKSARMAALPLPSRQDDAQVLARLNRFGAQAHAPFQIDVRSLFNAENGERPLYDCRILHGITGAVLADGVQGQSKKMAKHEAAKVAIDALWADRTARGELLPEDEAHRDGAVVEEAAPHPEGREEVVKVSYEEQQVDPLVLLGKLNQQQRMCVDVTVEDTSPDVHSPTFSSEVEMNGRLMASVSAASKKKAKRAAAEMALAEAQRLGWVVYTDVHGHVRRE